MDTKSDDADFIERVEGFLYSAIDLTPGEERERFLESACAGNARLRAAIEKRIAEQANVEQFFENNAALPCAGEISRTVVEREMARGEGDTTIIFAEESGKKIDAYTLRRKLGEGGCGSVYMAEQESPVRREVALKIIKLGMDTKHIIERFEAERHVMALMEHPNIAHVLDAGVTDTGRPYFVMELVRGVKITDYCDEHRLDMRQRLDLFMQVCHAIQHAHQKGIIHRDIKPSNVLVTEHDGIILPKVIDFGIAKATEAQLLSNATATGHGHFIGTPAYMSPEQAEIGGRDVDTRSDIYSLGVLLYELLTGVTPFDQKQLLEAGFDEMRRILREREPQRSSARMGEMPAPDAARIASQRRTDPHRLKSLLKGDIDWIVMKTLEKDRKRRYQSASGLVADIERHCANEPVVARPPSRIYRLGKLVRRNRAIFGGVAAVAVALILGFGTSTWFLLKEREALRRETRLRTEAEKGEKLSRAAFLAREGNFKEADTLLKEIGTPPAKPSLDGVVAYRAVGDWLATQERWQEASAQYVALIHLNQLEVWNPVTLDYQACGVLLVESGDFEEYARFCEKAVTSYATEKNGDASARVLKTCLLRPADAGFLKRAQPLAEAMGRWFATVNPKTAGSWPTISVTLWWYRSGDPILAAQGARKTLESRATLGSCEAALRLILAMSCYQNGQSDEARSELARGREIIDKGFKPGLTQRDGKQGYWYDWVFARILLREGDVLIKSGSK